MQLNTPLTHLFVHAVDSEWSAGREEVDEPDDDGRGVLLHSHNQRVHVVSLKQSLRFRHFSQVLLASRCLLFVLTRRNNTNIVTDVTIAFTIALRINSAFRYLLNSTCIHLQKG